VVSYLDSHRLPRLELRGPTAGPLDDVGWIRGFRESLLQPSGVAEPTVLAVNLEGRFPTPSVLLELVIPLAQAARSGQYGPLALVVCTPDEAVRTMLRALAQTHDLALFVARSPEELEFAEPIGALTPGEHETLNIVHSLGGRTTVSRFASAAGLEANAATNRLVNVYQKGFVQKVDRPRREGQLFLDPRAAVPGEEPADPTSGDFDVPEPIRRDVRALAEMQGREPGALLADAWREFLGRHSEHLAAEHERLAELVKNDDEQAVAAFGRRHAKKRSQARQRKQK
jgi:hypothetical protein